MKIVKVKKSDAPGLFTKESAEANAAISNAMGALNEAYKKAQSGPEVYLPVKAKKREVLDLISDMRATLSSVQTLIRHNLATY